ncbi:hypothetical protein [Legionella parisiensis]|uniref:Fir n=1 Tax=Legionella parisiensis TaxID=45071 RepID=A0A1E5JW96_9GAMM|nr:hypothetical protein [Legionella parisiensis]KTD39991.1 hypothetical protein Lpar_1308 [Legionella parisiensis]OEH48745.1 hypothetical protein lpari_00145 [Legionella parisiensis]STX77465.1 Uncharacterised protein [Legionella parisiensis]
MGFFKHDRTGEQGDPVREVEAQVKAGCTGPIEKMELVMSTRGVDTSALNEATETLKIINKVIAEGPEALPKEALQTIQTNQADKPQFKETFQQMKETQEVAQGVTQEEDNSTNLKI